MANNSKHKQWSIGQFGRVYLSCIAFLFIATSASVFAESSPSDVVQQDVTRILEVLRNDKLSDEQRRDRLREIFSYRFDFEDMAQRILAVNWESASEDQKAKFIELFKQVLENTYVTAIEKYTSEQVNVGGERLKGDKATVIVTIVRADETEIPLLFKLKQTNKGWRAYDANVEGVSIVSHYRQSYSEIVKNNGIEGLLMHMEHELSGGSMV